MVVAFCTGTVGAAGMSDPPEEWAPLLLGLGIGGILIGALLARYARGGTARAEEGHVRSKEAFRSEIERIRAIVVELDERKAELNRVEMAKRLDELLGKEYFDLTARHEELASLLGFTHYARVWEGVATAERLLARVWSLATDGHLEEALEDLPLARAHLNRACEAMG